MHITSPGDWEWNAPLALGYIKSALDAWRPGMDEIIPAFTAADVIAAKPDVLGVSCMSQDFDTAKAVLKEVRSSVGTIIMGGYHITARPGDLPDEVDHGIIGEAEELFPIIASLVVAFLKFLNFFYMS